MYMKRNSVISSPAMKHRGIVVNAFRIELQPWGEGFIATSSISDIYEAGANPEEAVLSYLSSLIAELVWFEEHKEQLSDALLQDLKKLHFYVRLA